MCRISATPTFVLRVQFYTSWVAHLCTFKVRWRTCQPRLSLRACLCITPQFFDIPSLTYEIYQVELALRKFYATHDRVESRRYIESYEVNNFKILKAAYRYNSSTSVFFFLLSSNIYIIYCIVLLLPSFHFMYLIWLAPNLSKGTCEYYDLELKILKWKVKHTNLGRVSICLYFVLSFYAFKLIGGLEYRITHYF